MLAPTAEIASAILDRLESQQALSGLSVWVTPQVRDFSSWIRQQYERQHFGRPEAPRLLSDLEERQIWRRVIADSDIAREFSDAGGAARSARRAKRALREYAVPSAALASYHGVESDALLQWTADFDARCRALNALSTDDILGALIAVQEMPAWIESPAWHPLALQWLERFAGAPLPAPAVGRGSRQTLHLHRSPANELAACAEWASAHRQSDPSFRGWILIPDLATRRAQVTDAFDSALVPGRFGLDEYAATPPYAIAGGTPLAYHEPVRIALATLQALCEELSFARFSALLRAPALQASLADVADAARLDEALRSRAPSEASLLAWIELCRRVAGLKSLNSISAVDRLQRLAARFRSEHAGRMLSRWVPMWIRALEEGPWTECASWSSAAYQAAERFRELQRTLACADLVYGPLAMREAIQALSTAARETTFQAQTGVAPIWITGIAQDPWLPYDGIWISGAAADEWPPAATPLALIPVQVQREYGVAGSTAALQLQRAQDLQHRWSARSASITFSCATRDGLTATPSSLLTAQAASSTAGNDSYAPDPLLRRLGAGFAVLQRFTDEEGPAFAPEDERTRGTSSLRDQSLCAFRGFARTRLRADRLELPEPGFNAMERGILLHAALEKIWRNLGGSAQLSSTPSPTLTALIAASVDAAIETSVARRDPGPRWRAREARRLKRLLPAWLAIESMRESFEVLELETERRAVRFAGLDFDVRIDRIDRLHDRTLVLVDYKSGDVSADWRGARPDNPQLPVYALSVVAPVAAVTYAQVQARTCRFLGFAEREQILPRVGARYAEADGAMAAELALWSSRIERIAEELRRGAAAVAPTPNACRSCDLQGLCRIASAGEASDAD